MHFLCFLTTTIKNVDNEKEEIIQIVFALSKAQKYGKIASAMKVYTKQGCVFRFLYTEKMHRFSTLKTFGFYQRVVLEIFCIQSVCFL